MYCTQCGKQIESGIICDECLKKQQAQEEVATAEAQTQSEEQKIEQEIASSPVTESVEVAPTKEVFVPPVGNKKAGLPKAIVGAILSVVALIIISACLSVVTALTEFVTENTITMEQYTSAVNGVLVFMFLSIAISIPALIFGIISVKTFKKEKTATGTKPIATLILGIVAIVYASCDVFASFVSIIPTLIL